MANLCKPIHDIINYSTSVCPFESGKFGKEGKKLQKFEYLENKKSFLDEIKNIFHSFWRAIIWWKNKNLIADTSFNKSSLKCCLSAPYYIDTLSYQDTLLFLYLSTSWSMCFIYVIYFGINIFIFIIINHIISLMQTNLFLGHVCQKLGLRVLVNFCLFFCQFQPGVSCMCCL